MLNLEILEDRLVPSAGQEFYWTGAFNVSWSNPANWAIGSPTGPVAISLPGATNPVFFDTVGYNCHIDGAKFSVAALSTEPFARGVLYLDDSATLSVVNGQYSYGALAGTDENTSSAFPDNYLYPGNFIAPNGPVASTLNIQGGVYTVVSNQFGSDGRRNPPPVTITVNVLGNGQLTLAPNQIINDPASNQTIYANINLGNSINQGNLVEQASQFGNLNYSIVYAPNTTVNVAAGLFQTSSAITSTEFQGAVDPIAGLFMAQGTIKVDHGPLTVGSAGTLYYGYGTQVSEPWAPLYPVPAPQTTFIDGGLDLQGTMYAQGLAQGWGLLSVTGGVNFDAGSVNYFYLTSLSLGSTYQCDSVTADSISISPTATMDYEFMMGAQSLSAANWAVLQAIAQQSLPTNAFTSSSPVALTQSNVFAANVLEVLLQLQNQGSVT